MIFLRLWIFYFSFNCSNKKFLFGAQVSAYFVSSQKFFFALFSPSIQFDVFVTCQEFSFKHFLTMESVGSPTRLIALCGWFNCRSFTCFMAGKIYKWKSLCEEINFPSFSMPHFPRVSERHRLAGTKMCFISIRRQQSFLFYDGFVLIHEQPSEIFKQMMKMKIWRR